MFLGSQHHSVHHQSAPNTPTGEYGDISTLEKEKVMLIYLNPALNLFGKIISNVLKLMRLFKM